jgi:hypothetical protein
MMNTSLRGFVASVVITAMALPSYASKEGISRLIAVAQVKAQSATNEAVSMAEMQRQLVAREKSRRRATKEAEAHLAKLEEQARRLTLVVENLRVLEAELKKNCP